MKNANKTLGTVGLIISFIPLGIVLAMICGVKFPGTSQYICSGILVLCLLLSLIINGYAISKPRTRSIPAFVGLAIAILTFVCGGMIMSVVGR